MKLRRNYYLHKTHWENIQRKFFKLNHNNPQLRGIWELVQNKRRHSKQRPNQFLRANYPNNRSQSL